MARFNVYFKAEVNQWLSLNAKDEDDAWDQANALLEKCSNEELFGADDSLRRFLNALDFEITEVESEDE